MQAIKSVGFSKRISKTSNVSTNQNIVRHFLNQAKSQPNQIAIIEREKSISFGELQSVVNQTAHYFKSKGISKGDRVLVFVPVSVDLYRVVLALFQIGAVAVFLDEWSSMDRLKKACEVAGCKGFVASWKGKLFGCLISKLRQIPIWMSPTQSKSIAPIEMEMVAQTDQALITFTTGSTGIPKAANRTHGFLNAQMEALVQKIKPKQGEIEMPALPIFVLLNLGTGVTSVLPDFNPRKPEKLNAKRIIDQIRKRRVMRLIASPFFVKKLATYLNDKNESLPSLRKVFTGGAPVFPDEADFLQTNFSYANVEVVYGSTEAEPISSVSANQLRKTSITKGLLVGKIFSKTDFKIIKIEDRAIDGFELERLRLPTGQIGEIVVAGDHVLSDYFRNEEAVSLNKIKKGNEVWHRTGDAGFADATGNLFLVGRCKQLIHFNQKMYAPFAIEPQLRSIDGINLGTVLLIDNQLVVFVEKGQGTNNSEIEKAIHKLFEQEEIQIQFLKKIPRDPRHFTKVDYEKLIQNYSKDNVNN